MKYLEDEHQKSLIQWADLIRLNALNGHKGTVGKYLIHIPNGGKRNKREAGRLKAQGVRAGFPDLFLFIPMHPWHGLAIEMKKPIIKGEPKPSVSVNQKEWLMRLGQQGYKVAVCFGWQQAKDEIMDYLNLN